MAQPAAVLSILITANSNQAVRGIARVNASLGATQAAGNKALASLKTLGKGAALGAGVGLGFAVKKAADFEQQLDSLGSVSGATAKDMERFRKQAMKAGADTKFSALDAAAAQTELAKGGLSVRNIMKGGLRSALALAAAGEMELGEAAATTANALNLFGLEGKSSMKVADALAKAANATTADVSDFAMALRQSGGVAKTAGLSFTETVLALEALANAGTKNSDAGTSLKTALIQLIKPTKTQAELADKLNLAFLDAQGNFKSMADVSDMLRDKLGGMTAAQRTATLATLAGTDGVRTLTALYDAGPSKLDKWSQGLNKSGTAAEVAAQKQDNLKGKLENLQGSIETVAIAIGSKMLPALTTAAEKVTDVINDPKLTGGEKFNKLAGMLGKAFEAAIPVVAEAAGKAGLVAVRALFNAFRDSGLLAKLVIGGFLLSKLGGLTAFQNLGSKAGGAMADGTAKTFGSTLKSRMGGIGKSIGIGLLFAGLADAMTREDISGFGDRLGTFLSTATLGAIPPPRTISEKLQWSINQAARGLDPRSAGFDRAFESLGSSLPDKEREIVERLKGMRLRAIAAFGGDIAINPTIKRGATEAITAGFQWIRVNGSKDMQGLREKVDFNARLIEKSLDVHSAGGRRVLRANFEAGMESVLKSMRKGKTGVKEGMKLIEHFARVHSDGSKDSIARNMELAKDAIFRTMQRAGQITEAGMRRIYDITVAQLALYGLSPEEALKGNIPKLKPLPNLGGSPTPRGGVPNNPPSFFPNQRGGSIFGGAPTGDSIPAMLERGEYVLNRKAVQAAGKKQLDALNFGVASRFQQGGVVAPINVGGPESGLRSIVQASLDRSREGANSVIRGAAQAFATASAGGETSTTGLVPQVLKALEWARSHGWGGSVTSGFRTRAEQAVLYARYLAGGNIAAAPGTSSHEKGQAVDVTDVAGFAKAMASAPANAKLLNLVPGDALHFSVTGHQKGGLVGMQSGGAVTLAPDVGKAVVQWGPKIGWLARQRYADKLREPEGIDLLGKLTAGENMGRMGGAPSDAGARGAFQFIPSTREAFMSKFNLDPWRSAMEAAQSATLHLSGKHGWDPGLEGYNPGGGQGYVSYILGQNYRFPPGVGGGSGTPLAAVERAHEQARKRTAKFRRKLAHVKRPTHRLLDKVQGVGIPEGLKDRIGDLTKKSEIYGEFGDRAGQLNLERLTEAGESVLDSEGRPITDLGLIDGKTETEWLTKQLDVLFKLRNSLVRAHNLVVDYREQLSGAIERAKVKLAAVNKKLGRKGLGQQERRKLLLERGGLRKLVGGLEGRRSKANTSRGNILEALEGVQGHPTGSALTRLLSLPPLGILGGQIFDTQMRLQELWVKPAISDTATPEVSESAELLRGLLRDANLRTAVSQAQYPEFLRYMGAFAKGGVALVGERGPELAHMPSGTRVHSSSDTQAMLAPNVSVVVNGDIVGTPRGKDPVEVLLNDRRFDSAVRNVRSSRTRPGRAGSR